MNYKFEIRCGTDENGYARLIGFVEIDTEDYGLATEVAKYMANTGQFDTENDSYTEDDVVYVNRARF